jgi:hypothetical protein
LGELEKYALLIFINKALLQTYYDKRVAYLQHKF